VHDTSAWKGQLPDRRLLPSLGARRRQDAFVIWRQKSQHRLSLPLRPRARRLIYDDDLGRDYRGARDLATLLSDTVRDIIRGALAHAADLLQAAREIMPNSIAAAK
jgi:hypothetical protein